MDTAQTTKEPKLESCYIPDLHQAMTYISKKKKNIFSLKF